MLLGRFRLRQFADRSGAYLLDRLQSAVGVGESQLRADAVAEIGFAHVALHVVLAAVLIDTLYAALEDRKVVFQRIDADAEASGVFLFGVVGLRAVARCHRACSGGKAGSRRRLGFG